MSITIQEILKQRIDISNYLVHLTKDSNIADAKQNLISILKSQRIDAKNPFGMAYKKLENKKLCVGSQKVVCFTEIPLDFIPTLTQDIVGRSWHFKPYGIIITRQKAREKGINPVWYLDITQGHNWLTQPIDALINKSIDKGCFDSSEISKLTPFIEQMGTNANSDAEFSYTKEFWWEREWRKVGDLDLPTNYKIICPAKDKSEIQSVIDNLDQENFGNINATFHIL